MSGVYSGLGNLLLCCIRGHKNVHYIHPTEGYDSSLVWKDNTVEKSGSVAYNVIIKEASRTESPILTPRSRARLEAHEIEERQKQALIRKESIEAKKIENICRNRARAQEAIDKLRHEEDLKVKEMQDKINKENDACLKNRQDHLAKMRLKLQIHLQYVDEVCKKSSVVATDLLEQIILKQETAEKNRQAQLQATIDRVRDHANHILEVIKASENTKNVNEEKMIQRMESALKKREENLQALQEKLSEHEKRIINVREKRKVLACGDNLELNNGCQSMDISNGCQ